MLPPNNTASNPRCPWTLLQAAVYATLVFAAPPGIAQAPPEITFNLLELPSSRQALNTLNKPAIATFENRPLAECLSNLSEIYKIPIWIDRRVDRSRLISLVGLTSKEYPDANTTFGRIRAVANLGGVEAGLVENVIYVGPPDQLAHVQFAAIRLHHELMTARERLANGTRVESKPLRWEELTTPSDLLKTLEQQWSIAVDATLPHDLMHAGTLPSSTMATQLTLLFAGFDLQANFTSPTALTTSPLANDLIWQSEYSAKEIQTARYAAVKKEHPQASMQIKNGICTLTGPTAFHLKMLAIRALASRDNEPKFTLGEVRGPLGQIVGGLGKHLSLTVEWSDSIPLTKKQAVVTFSVPKAKTPDEILRQLGEENALSIQRQGETMIVSPGQE